MRIALRLVAVLAVSLVLAAFSACGKHGKEPYQHEPTYTRGVESASASVDPSNGSEGVIDFRSGGTPRWRVPDTQGFTINCDYTKAAAIDPIVAPGGVSSHVHTFEGGDVTANSTVKSLLAGGTSCHEPTHKTGYWEPQLQQQDSHGKWNPVKIGFLHVYNRKVRGTSGANLKPPQNGLKIIAGSPASTSTQPGIVDWGCSGKAAGAGPAGYLKPVSCDPNGTNPWVKVLYRFPSCFQFGVLDSADHHSHARYPVGYFNNSSADTCPDGYYETPIATMSIRYLTHSGQNLRFSSGDVDFTGHADIFWAMDRDVYAERIAKVLN